MISGVAKSRHSPAKDADFDLMFHPNQLPSDALTSMPKMLRLQSQTHRDPPRAPVISYHCTAHVVRANELPSTSHGHEISASK